MPSREFAQTNGVPSAGFTLVEMCWTMLVFSLVAGIAFTSMQQWAAAERFRATTSAVEGVIRETQQRAITEGRTLCLGFDLSDQSYSVLRGPCGSSGQVRIEGPVRPEPGVALAEASFAAPGGGTSTGVTFYPRGTATPGTLRVTRTDPDRVDIVIVDGLTGRVTRG